MKKTTIATFFLLSILKFSYSTTLPAEYFSMRESMYNFEKSAKEIENDLSIYTNKSMNEYEGYELHLILARYEYIAGRAFFYEKNNNSACLHYEKGIEYAKKAVKEDSNAESLLIYAENISAACTVKPVSWVIVWGAKIAGLDKKILKLDPSNAAALYMLNSQDVYAPKPLCNWSRGLKNMTSMLKNKTLKIEKDDMFNIVSAIGYAYMMKKDKENAIKHFEKSLLVYPNNLYVKGLIAKLNSKE